MSVCQYLVFKFIFLIVSVRTAIKKKRFYPVVFSDQRMIFDSILAMLHTVSYFTQLSNKRDHDLDPTNIYHLLCFRDRTQYHARSLYILQ